MKETPAGHVTCWNCHAAFPQVWIEKGDAPKSKDGKQWCSFTCEAIHKERELQAYMAIACPVQTSPFNE